VQRGTLRRWLVPAVATLGLSSAVVIGTTSAPAGAVTWTAVSSPLPADAAPGQGMTLVSDVCPVDGWCIAVGNYPAVMAGVPYTAGLIVSQTGSTSTAMEAPLPANASPTDPQAMLTSVDCAQVGLCMAVGRYLDSTGATQGLIEQLSADVWTPIEAPLPAGAISAGWADWTSLSAVSCPVGTWCMAVGVYTPVFGQEQAFSETYGWANWWPGAVPLPAGIPGSQFLALSCPAVSQCVGTAEYPNGPVEVGMIETLAMGTWTESTLALPAGASPVASVFGNHLPVTCSSTGACVVAGTAFDGTYWGFLDTLSSGSWSATYAPVPSGLSTFDLQLTAVSCADASFCVAVGSVNATGADQGLVETLSSGSWSGSLAPAPAGTSPSASIDLHDVNCPADFTCVADGLVSVSGGPSAAASSVTGEMLSLAGSSWTAAPAPLPADAAANPAPTFSPLTCPAIGACVTAGTYIGASGREGVLEEDPALQPTTTTASVSLVSSQTVAYSASVSGGSGALGGTITFSSGPEQLCVASVSNGTASCSGALGPAGTVLASYSGDNADAPSWGSTSNPYGPVHITAIWGAVQGVKVGKYISYPLIAGVTNAAGIGVPGVPVTFTAPTTGATGTFSSYATVATNSGGSAIAPAFKANGKAGSYSVVATAPGVPGAAVFSLTNTRL